MTIKVQNMRNVFVTVGTTSFDELIRIMDSDDMKKLLHTLGYTHVRMQIGRGTYIPQTCSYIDIAYYRYDPDYQNDIQNADLVISHAGTAVARYIQVVIDILIHSLGAGSIMDALEAHKKLLVVVNTTLMDDHQRELADALACEKYLLATDSCSGLISFVHDHHEHQTFEHLVPYPGLNHLAFPALVDDEMKTSI